MKTILVPTDFSPAANAATKFAISLAKQFDSSIFLLHVLEAVDEGSFNIEGEATSKGSWEDKLFNMKMIEKARKDLADATAIATENGVRVQSVLRVGNPYHGIQAIIAEQKADMVVIGTEGDSGNANILLGTTAEKVVRRSTIPVISVNRNLKTESIKTIVWATSLRPEDLDIPSILREFVNQPGVTVHILRVNTPGLFMTDITARERLKSTAEFLKFKNYTTNIFNDNEEAAGIIHFAAHVNADLIALSTHGRQGLAHLLNASIAEDVINHTKRPVMTYVLGIQEVRK
jgi:nucleotide-binding universal stress UspA family protein